MTVRVYLRISRPGEASILENQRRNALEYAERQGYTQVQVYSETISGSEEDRPGLGALLRDIRRGDTVIFSSLSRMTRKGVGASLGILERLRARGASWHFLETPILDYDSSTPKMAQDIILAVLAAVAEDYSRHISERTKAALRLAKSQGRNVGGTREGAGRPRKNQRSPPTPFEAETVDIHAPLKTKAPP